jgi:hypothetical protein
MHVGQPSGGRGDERVAALVIGGPLPLLGGEHAPALLRAGEHALYGLLQLRHLDLRLALANGEKGGLVHDVRQVGAGEARRPACEKGEVHGRIERLVGRMELEDELTADDVGLVDRHVTVEPAGAQERRVEDVGTVRGADHDDARADIETVHLHEQLVQGLLAFVAAAAASLPALAAGRVELVDEDDRRGDRADPLKQIAHARRAYSHERFDELGTGH